MNMKAKLSAATAALVLAPFVSAPVTAAPHFEVKITNITKAQTFTPILLFSHNVCQGEGFNPSRDGAEGFLHVHDAIHGIGDLPTSSWDWRNPVAQVRVKLVP